MNRYKHFLSIRSGIILSIVFILNSFIYGQNPKEIIPRLENPISVDYLKKNLKKGTSRLILSEEIEKNLKAKLKTDPSVLSLYKSIQYSAYEIMQKPLLTRKMTGRRLLGVSREFLERVGNLSMVYRIEKDKAVLNRIDQELNSVCSFSDWNPSHYLDVAEMSLGVALAVDWVGKYLPRTTVELAKNALIEKGINPGYVDEQDWWVDNNNNWNQVCHGGMIAAAIVIAKDNPELAAKVLSRALNGMPNALNEYAPDGVYPEGASYWQYGTTYSVITSSILSSAFGTDFGITKYPSFLESADFMYQVTAPSGWYFNFADCGDRSNGSDAVTLAWFATKTGNSLFFDEEYFINDPYHHRTSDRFLAPGLVWVSEYEQTGKKQPPINWKGDGANPVVVFRGDKNDPGLFYFAAKGGKGSSNHGNMDAGSFIFELDGIRWAIDPGNQNYNELEQSGFDLWSRCQECDRWKLLTKNNFGHSTITVNNNLHNVDGFASIIEFKDQESPEAVIDLSEVFKGNLKSAKRKFIKENNQSVLINDEFEFNDSTKTITWAMMTTAQVMPVDGGAILKKDGKELNLDILSPENIDVSIISLNPPPLKLDKKIEGLKRIEIRVPAYLFPDKKGNISVRLSGK